MSQVSRIDSEAASVAPRLILVMEPHPHSLVICENLAQQLALERIARRLLPQAAERWRRLRPLVSGLDRAAAATPVLRGFGMDLLFECAPCDAAKRPTDQPPPG